MRVDELRQLLRREPFLPFMLYVTDGRSFEVRHPEFVGITPSSLILIVPGVDHPSALPERRIGLSLLHITGYEQVQPTAPPTAN
jgi:hypothetical protein